jgi:hypothetical protein
MPGNEPEERRKPARMVLVGAELSGLGMKPDRPETMTGQTAN